MSKKPKFSKNKMNSTQESVAKLKSKIKSLEKLNNYEEAIKCYNAVLKKVPRDKFAWHGKGAIFEKLNNYEEAIKCYNTVLRIDPMDMKGLINKGNSLEKLNNYEEAIKCYNTVLRIDPDHVRILNKKLKLFEKLNNYEEAIKCYNTVLRIDPNDKVILQKKRDAFRALGNHEEAINCHNKILELDNAHRQVLESMGQKSIIFETETSNGGVFLDKYKIKYPNINDFEWETRKITDSERFKSEISNYMIDKRGIIGSELFELTLDNLGAGIDRGIANSKLKNLEVEEYNFMCPELENFITIVLWLNYDNDQQVSKNEELGNVLTDYIDRNDPNEKCVMKENYRIRDNHFGDIVPFRGRVEVRQKNKLYYEWKRAPFLKRSAETFTYHYSPAFMPLFPESESGATSSINLFSAPFKLEMMSENGLELLIPSATTYKKGIFEIKKPENRVYGLLSENSKGWYQGLFQEKIFRSGGAIQRIFEIIDVSSIQGDDFLGHMLSQRLYYNYIKNQDLKICTDDELYARYESLVKQMYRTYGLDAELDFKRFKLLYLNNYFVNLNENWYYKPYLFKDLNIELYSKFLDYLDGKYPYKDQKGYEFYESLKIQKDFNEYINRFNFLKLYNKYSKSELIELINAGGAYVWRM